MADPSQFRVSFLAQSIRDLQLIESYIAQSSPANAVEMVARLVEAANSLALFPFRYQIRKTHRSPAKQVRAMPYSPFVIYYRVREPAQLVTIIAIRHGARRRPKGFF